jgi:hypothetical protein
MYDVFLCCAVSIPKLQANISSAGLSTKLSQAEETIDAMKDQLSSAEAEMEGLRSSLLGAEQTLESERKQSCEEKENIEAKSFELQSEVLCLQGSLATASKELEELTRRQEQLTFLLDEKQERAAGGDVNSSSNRTLSPKKLPLKSSSNKTAVVVPVRQAPSSAPALSSHHKIQHRGPDKSTDYYSNDSDCVLVKDDAMEYVEVDTNAQSDLENGSNMSENSSVVVQWKNILHRPGTNTSNSPNSDSATDTSSPTKSGVAGNLRRTESSCGGNGNGRDGNVVPKVESLLSITSCSSDNSIQDHDATSRTERDGSGLSEGGRGDYFFVNELKRELHRLRQELSSYHMAAEEQRRSATAAEDARAQAVQDYNELKAFHERTKKLLSSPDSAMNIEYLKKCVYRLMVTKELSERSRLYPVISMLLKFTPIETREVTAAIEEEVKSSEYLIGNIGVSPATWLSASSTLGGLFGGGGAVHGAITSSGEVLIAEEEDATNSTSNIGSSSSSWW